MDFVNGDIVVFKADAAKREYQVAGFTDDGMVQISGVSGDIRPNAHSDNTYPNLITLAEPLMQFFRFGNLPQHLQDTSFWFWQLACTIITKIPRNPERTVALRKLLEAKDAAVRSTIYQS